MTRYVIRRLLWAVVLFLAVTIVTFVIFFVIPVNPAALVAGKAATPQEVGRSSTRSISTGRCTPVLALPEPARLPPQPRPLLR